MGRIVGFQGRQHNLMIKDGKFNSKIFTSLLLLTTRPHSPRNANFPVTEWRRDPTHQGGYILDGGVHYMAGIRQLLASKPGNEISRVSAFTSQIQEYLPPADTVDALFKTKSGVTGVFQLSVGTTLRENSWTVVCEDAWIKIEDSQVTIYRDGKEVNKTVPNERTGVPPEVRAWGAALAAGKVLPEQEPETALADLELVRETVPSHPLTVLKNLHSTDSCFCYRSSFY